MIKISRDPGKVPRWLKCKKNMIPDFVAEDPKVCKKALLCYYFKYVLCISIYFNNFCNPIMYYVDEHILLIQVISVLR